MRERVCVCERERKGGGGGGLGQPLARYRRFADEVYSTRLAMVQNASV